MTLEYGIPTDKEAFRLELGIEKGFFREEGLDLKIRVVFGGPEIVAMYNSGQLKIGQLGSPPATTALAKGARFKIVGSCVRRRALQYFVAQPAVESWAALRGKAIGVLSIGSCSYWFARMVLERHGLDPDHDVDIVGLGPRYANVVDLFGTQELAGAVVSEPNLAIGEHRGAFRVLQALTEPDFCPSMQWSVIVANESLMAQDPSVVVRVLRACRKSYHYAADHDAELAQFCFRRFGVEPQAMLRAIERERPYLHYDCEIDMDGLDLAINLQRSLGAFDTPLRAQDAVDLRFLNRLTHNAA